jgi:xylulokinase
MLGVTLDRVSELALRGDPGAGGLVVVPYLEGERTPNRPDATGAIHGLRLATATPEHLARAAVEGMLCGLADGLDAIRGQGVPLERIILVGGGSRSNAVRQIAPAIFGAPVTVPVVGEYVGNGAARQAAWVLSEHEAPPEWPLGTLEVYDSPGTPAVRERYAEVRDLTATRVPSP